MALLAAVLASAALVAGARGEPSVKTPPTVLPEVPATPVDLAQETANNSPALAVDPTDSRLVALASRIDAPQFSCQLHLSGDAGRGWRPADPLPRLPPGAERCYAPEVGFDSRGVLYYLFAGLAGRGNRPMGIFLTTSSNQGRSFSTPRRLLGPNNYQTRMVIEPGTDRIHLVWLAPGGEPSVGGLPSTPNPIMAAHSDDHGRTFSDPVQVSDADRARVVAPAIAVTPDGRVHVLYYDLGDDAVDYQGLEGATWDGTWSLVLASSDGGGRFSPGVVIDDSVEPPERVMLIFTMPPPALAAGSGGLYAAWHDARNGDWDVFLRASSDGGRTWTGPVRLNDDPLGSGRHQYLPRLGVAPGGRVDAVFSDRRDDAGNQRNRTYYTYSGDGGRTFAANLPLATGSSLTTVGPQYLVTSAIGMVEFGGRLALSSGDAGALVGWTDTRNSFPGRQQDVFVTEVMFAPGRRPPAPPPKRSALPMVAALGAAAVLTGGSLVFLARRRRRHANPNLNPSGDDQ